MKLSRATFASARECLMREGRPLERALFAHFFWTLESLRVLKAYGRIEGGT